MRPLSLIPLAVTCLHNSHWCYVAVALYFTAVILLITVILLAVKCHNLWDRCCRLPDAQSKPFLYLCFHTIRLHLSEEMQGSIPSQMLKSPSQIQPARHSQWHWITSNCWCMLQLMEQLQQNCRYCFCCFYCKKFNHLIKGVSQLWSEIMPQVCHDKKQAHGWVQLEVIPITTTVDNQDWQ